MVNTKWFQPRLINLPDQYYKIFQAYRNKTCPVCSNIPKDPCVCLICGVFLCFRESCCRQQHVYECVQVFTFFSLKSQYKNSSFHFNELKCSSVCGSHVAGNNMSMNVYWYSLFCIGKQMGWSDIHDAEVFSSCFQAPIPEANNQEQRNPPPTLSVPVGVRPSVRP